MYLYNRDSQAGGMRLKHTSSVTRLVNSDQGKEGGEGGCTEDTRNSGVPHAT